MPELAILRRRSPARGPKAAGRHPKALLRTEDGLELVLPFAPRGTSLGGWADAWEAIGRPGRPPLVKRTGDGLDTLGITVLLAHADHQDHVEGMLGTLRRIARSGDRVTLVNLSPLEAGPWRLADVNVTGELRQEGTNRITRATVGLEFLAAVDANPKLGPLTGGKKGNPKAGKGKAGSKGKANRRRTHVVRQGETLRKIADRYYGDPSKWQRIARANKVKHPRNMPVGRKLTIPPIEGGRS